MAKETTKEKGQRLADEGKVECVGMDKHMVHGDSGSYLVEAKGIVSVCPCPSFKKACSHVEAVNIVLLAEMRGGVALTPDLVPNVKCFVEDDDEVYVDHGYDFYNDRYDDNVVLTEAGEKDAAQVALF